MSRDFPEADWKVFRQLSAVALDRFCQRVLSEIERVASDTEKSHHERYLAICRLINQKDRELAKAFNDPSRSNAVFLLLAIQSHKLLTPEEMERFSPETREAVRTLLQIHGP